MSKEPRKTAPANHGPLTGVRVVDMTGVLLGPVTSQVLGDLGADIVKIEPPEGDTSRGIGPSQHSGMGSLFLHNNRNKRSLVLDLKQEAGCEAMRKLLAGADVFLHNKRPKTLARLGFDYESVRALNENIVYCAAFGYGQGGRYADRPAYDDLIQGAVAMPTLFERYCGQPLYVPAALIDRLIGLTAAYSVMGALFHRERTGKGQCIEVPMYEHMTQMVLADHMGGATFDPPKGPAGYARLLSPGRKPYRTRDGYVGTLAYTNLHWSKFFAAVGRPDLAADPRFATLEARTQHIDELYRFAEAEYAKRDTAEWIELLDKLDIPVTRVNTLESLLEDPHLADVGFFQWMDHPSQGRVRMMPAAASTWSETPPTLRRLAPQLGEHSRELLAELGYATGDIDALMRGGISREPTRST